MSQNFDEMALQDFNILHKPWKRFGNALVAILFYNDCHLPVLAIEQKVANCETLG